MLFVCFAARSPSSSTVDPTTPTTTGPTPTTAQVPILTCYGSQASVPQDFTEYFDAVALPTSPKYPNALQTSAQNDDPATRLFAKIGLWYRADHRFEILVPDNLKGELAIGWGGGPATPGSGVTSTPCPGARHDWVVLPGGYWLSHTMCATLFVLVDDKQQEARIGLGEPCQGQAPPAGPSDK
jgi:hypothetical protein